VGSLALHWLFRMHLIYAMCTLTETESSDVITETLIKQKTFTMSEYSIHLI